MLRRILLTTKGWGISGFKNERANCADLILLKRLVAAGYGKFGEWLKDRGMATGTGSYGYQVGCYNQAPVPLGRFRVFNAPNRAPGADLLGVPADTVAVNVIESRKPAAREFSYISPGEAP